MNTANWVPDLFMKRVELENSTLFSPGEAQTYMILPALHLKKDMKNMKRWLLKGKWINIKLFQLKSMAKNAYHVIETGHPWITFKDSCNLRSPQQHIE